MDLSWRNNRLGDNGCSIRPYFRFTFRSNREIKRKAIMIGFLNLIIVLVILVLSPLNSLAWDTDTVHPYITFNASDKAYNLDRFLNDLGIASESFDSGDSRDF